MTRIALLVMLICPLLVQGQLEDTCHHELKGVIHDIDTKEPLPYVKIHIKGTQKVILTDIEGKFHFKNVCEESNTLIISCYGYCDTTCEQYHEHEEAPSIYLKQDVQSLKKIIINVDNKKEDGILSKSQRTISKEELEENPTQSLAQALTEIDGVTLTSTGNNVQLPVIHGLYGNRILILNNGIKHGFQNWGTDHAPEIDITAANSITVIKGAAGVRYGPEALAGAIIVESNPLYLNEPLQATLGTGFQTNGRGYFIQPELSYGGKKWSYHLGANYTRLGDQHAPTYSLTNSGKEEKSVNTGIRYSTKKWDVKLYYSYIDQDLALLRSSVTESGTSFVKALSSNTPIIVNPFSYKINEPNQLTQHHFGKAECVWWYSKEGKITFRAGTQLNKRQEYDVRRNAQKPIIDLDLSTNDFQLEWKHPSWHKLKGLIGVQLFTQNNDNNPGTGTTPFIPNYNITRHSAFIIESIQKHKNTVELGLRFDNEYNNVRGRETNQDIFRDAYTFSNLTSSIGYIRQLKENSTFRTNIGLAWRTPNMAELYSFGQHGFQTTFGLLRHYTDASGELSTDKVLKMDESALAAEKGYKWMSEWRHQKGKNSYTVTLYSHLIKDYIYDRPYAVIGTIRGPMPVFIYDQTNAFFMGTDFTWQKDWSGSFSSKWDISYLWSKDIENNSPLINQPPISTSSKLTWNLKTVKKLTDIKLSIKPSYTFKQFQAPRTVTPEQLIDGIVDINPQSEIFDFKDVPSGYFLLDMGGQFKFNHIRVSFSIQNILNTSYRNYLNHMRYFANETGRNFLLTIKYTFNTKSNTK